MYILDLNHIDSALGLEYLTIEEINTDYPHHKPKQHHNHRGHYRDNHHPHHRHRPHHHPHHPHHRHHRPSYFSNHNLLTGYYPYGYLQNQNISNIWNYPNFNALNCSYLPGCLYLSNIGLYYDIVSMFALFMFVLCCLMCRKKRTKTIVDKTRIDKTRIDKNGNKDKMISV
jgi:hypothetical protein